MVGPTHIGVKNMSDLRLIINLIYPDFITGYHNPEWAGGGLSGYCINIREGLLAWNSLSIWWWMALLLYSVWGDSPYIFIVCSYAFQSINKSLSLRNNKNEKNNFSTMRAMFCVTPQSISYSDLTFNLFTSIRQGNLGIQTPNQQTRK